MMSIKALLNKILDFFRIEKSSNLDFLCGGRALPAPYSPEEEEQKLNEIKAGSSSARDDLIEHNLRLVVYIAKKFENTGLDVEDLISVGTIGLIKAVNSFDNSRNIKLATYASRCIENEILMLLRKMVKVKNEVSIDEPLNVDGDGNQLLLCDVLGTEEDVVYEKIESDAEKDVLLETFKTLTERERDIISLRFGLFGKEEMTQKDIADMMGISQSYISRLEKKVVKKLRKEIIKLV
ncbi:MAG: RNA polymerase sporulation sigma factor SigE [Eubacteriales bacterium]|nr:RNA polymerase sporulation sigma factor SigE [Eubacteriales bacterium]MDY5439733.1 RNA polymerase sporulation sigma factor SigE [Eubacteriales bacterium]